MKEKWGITALLLTVLFVLSYFVYRELSPDDSSFTIPPNRFDYILNTAPSTAAVSLAYNLAGSTAPFSEPRTEREKQVAAAIAKYGSRPVVLEFIEDLKKDPCTAKVIEDEKITDMIGALSAARRAGCIDKLKLKYAFRPQFIKLMAEVMTDPEVRPLLESVPEAPPAAIPANSAPVNPAPEPDQSSPR